MTLVLLLFGGLMLVQYISNQVVAGLENKVDVTAYFKQDAAESDILQVKQDLMARPDVSSVTYVSQDQALADFKAKHAGDPLIQQSLDELSDNPLEASLNIKAKQSDQYSNIVNFLEGSKFRAVVDKINFYENESVIQRVQNIANGLRNWGLLATLILAFIAVLVTFNTIRLTIYNQRQEIEIMRLVGGSNWHIRAPFLIEGGLYGLFAGLAATVIFYPVVWFISSKAQVLLPGVSLIKYFMANAGQFLLIVVGAGIVLGIISSYIATRRFLKV